MGFTLIAFETLPLREIPQAQRAIERACNTHHAPHVMKTSPSFDGKRRRYSVSRQMFWG